MEYAAILLFSAIALFVQPCTQKAFFQKENTKFKGKKKKYKRYSNCRVKNGPKLSEYSRIKTCIKTASPLNRLEKKKRRKAAGQP